MIHLDHRAFAAHLAPAATFKKGKGAAVDEEDEEAFASSQKVLLALSNRKVRPTSIAWFSANPNSIVDHMLPGKLFIYFPY